MAEQPFIQKAVAFDPDTINRVNRLAKETGINQFSATCRMVLRRGLDVMEAEARAKEEATA